MEYGVFPSYFAGYAVERPGYRWIRETGLDNWLLIVTLSGAGRLTARSGETRDLIPGEAVRYRPRAHNDYAIHPEADRWEMLWVHVVARPYWKPLLDWPEWTPGSAVASYRDPERVHARMRGAVEATRGSGVLAELEGLNAIKEALLLCRKGVEAPAEKGLDPRIQTATEFIARNYAKPIGVREIAAAAGLSPSRLSALFRQEIGTSPRVDLERVRIEKARRMLEMTALPIGAIAEAVGWSNPFHFSGRFRKLVGRSPSDYRKG